MELKKEDIQMLKVKSHAVRLLLTKTIMFRM